MDVVDVMDAQCAGAQRRDRAETFPFVWSSAWTMRMFSVAIDGNKIDYWSSSPSIVASRLYDIAPISITIIPGDVIHVQIGVEMPVIGSNNRLFVAVVEDSNYYPSSPNGEVWANNVLRKLLPSSSGQIVDLSTVGTQNFSFPLTLDPSWDTDRLQIVAWVQDWSASTASYCVSNAKVAEWRLTGYYHTVDAERTKEIAAPADTASFAVSLGNIGSFDDTYGVWFEADVPAGWVVSAEHDGVPFDSTGISLASLASANIDIIVAPVGHLGEGTIRMLVQSSGDSSGAIDTVTFTVMAGGNLLYVAASVEASANIPYFEDMFADNGVNYQEWSVPQDGALPDLSNAPYEAIVWHDGDNLEASLSLQDRNSILNFLDNGGKMLVTSAGWARTNGSIFDFYYMGIGAINDGIDTSPSSVTGTYGGTEFTGYTATLGGDVAEGFTVSSPSRGILRLSSGKTCGLIRETDGGGRLVYISFMLEDVPSETERDDFWNRVVEFWGGLDVAEQNLPKAKGILDAYPNPFNEMLSIDVVPPRAGAINVDIFDLSGRLVSAVFDGTVPAEGITVRWDAHDVPSGLYLVRARGESFSAEVKTLLIK